MVPQIRSFFFVTTMLPFTHWTSVTTSTSVHGPEQEVLLDELEEVLEEDDDDEEIAEEETDELDGDDKDELLDVELELD